MACTGPCPCCSSGRPGNPRAVARRIGRVGRILEHLVLEAARQARDRAARQGHGARLGSGRAVGLFVEHLARGVQGSLQVLRPTVPWGRVGRRPVQPPRCGRRRAPRATPGGAGQPTVHDVADARSPHAIGADLFAPQARQHRAVVTELVMALLHRTFLANAGASFAAVAVATVAVRPCPSGAARRACHGDHHPRLRPSAIAARALRANGRRACPLGVTFAWCYPKQYTGFWRALRDVGLDAVLAQRQTCLRQPSGRPRGARRRQGMVSCLIGCKTCAPELHT